MAKTILAAAFLSLALLLNSGVAAAASASGTTVPGSATQIVDAQGNKWTLANGSVAINGMSLCSSPPAILLVYLGSTVYEENNAGAWFWWNGSAWVQNSCGDPRISGGSSSGSGSGSGSGSSSSSGSSSGGSSSSSSGTTSSSSSGTTSSSTGSSSGTASGSSSGSGSCSPGTIPAFDHVVLVMEENHGYGEIIGSSEAPYINSLANHGALFTNSFAIGHPSEPNYFALFSGSDWGIADDNDYNFPGPTLAGELKGKSKTFVGYIDSGSPRHHNPWESFADSQNVEQPFSSFPSDFTKLPLVSWVIPNLNNDMHDGTIQQGDGWLQSNLSTYATWAQTHNSLLIVQWDEDDSGGNNQIATIFFGANVAAGQYNELINHYNVLKTLEDMFGLAPLANSKSAAPITDAWHCSGSSASSSSSSSSGSASSWSSGSSSGTTGSTSGVCRSDNNQTLSSTPTHLCTAGTPTAVTTDGAAWIWNCDGTGIGDTPGCFAWMGNSSSSSSGGTTGSSSPGTRNWIYNPGQDRSMWVQPFFSTATWDKSSAMDQQLFANGGNINLWPNYAAPFYIGQAGDPTGTVTDGTHSITVHLPAGVQVEQPTSQYDQSIGGVDATQPYLYWNISGATIDGSPQGTWRQGSVIQGTYGFMVGDASGLIMEDVVTGMYSQNAMGNIQEYELQQALADPNYVIQHMLCFQQSNSVASGTHIWPLSANDTGSGLVPEGTIIGIPYSDVRPAGKSRAWYLLYDNLKQYGWMFYNTGPDAINIMVIPQSSATQSLANDIGSEISDVLTHAAILTNQTGPSSIKGYTPGATSPYPSPPLLDYSPTGGVAVLPSTFGAWYPGGYNVKSVPGGVTP